MPRAPIALAVPTVRNAATAAIAATVRLRIGRSRASDGSRAVSATAASGAQAIAASGTLRTATRVRYAKGAAIAIARHERGTAQAASTISGSAPNANPVSANAVGRHSWIQ